MISSKRAGFIFLACAAIIACAIFARRAHQSLNATNAERARILAQNTALTTRIHTAESDLAQVKAGWKDEQAATTNSDDSTLYAYARGIANWNATMKRLNNDPKYQELLHKEKQFYVERDYGLFIAKGHLTPDQAVKLKKALVQREMDQNDLNVALESQGLADDDPSGLVIKQQSDDAFQQSVEDMLGSDGYAQFDAYDRQRIARNMMISHYTAAFMRLGSPMTPGQIEQMVGHIAQNNPDYQEGKVVNIGQIDWPAVNEYARTIMTPEQFDLFTHITANIAINQKIGLAFDAIEQAAGKQNADDVPSR